MRDGNRSYVAVGAFVLAMLVALVAWIAVLSGRTSATDSYYILWNNVMGLKAGTQILFEGYQIGLIDGIGPSTGALSGGKNYRVDISVERGWPIPDSAVAVATAPTFLAALVVDIRAGDSTTLLAPGSELSGREQGDLLSAASDAMESVTDALDFLKPVLEEITSSVNSVLSDENAAQITNMLSVLNTRVEEILSAENAENIENILSNLNRVSEDVSELTNGLRETKQEVDTLLLGVNDLMDDNSGDIGHALSDLHASLETVSRHIDAIANNLEGTARNANEFSGQIRENPGVLLRGRETADEDPAGP